jgi:molybdate transport system permease protein
MARGRAKPARVGRGDAGQPAPGRLVAYALARGRFPGRQLLNGLVHLPLILPPVVTGYLLLLTFGRKGPVGAWLEHWFGIVFAFRWTGAALAAAVMAFPLMVRAMRLAIEAVDPRLEQAAATLGASRPWVFADRDAAPDPARRGGGRDPGLCQGDGRIRRDDHLRLEHPRPDPDPALGDLCLPAGAGGRGAGGRLVMVAIVIAMAALLLSEWVRGRWRAGSPGHDADGFAAACLCGLCAGGGVSPRRRG